MDLNQIRSFIAVTQTLNFTNAAKQNGVPQSTVSRQINDLESQLGVKLFYRTKRDVKLTDEGRTFLPYAQEMIEASKQGCEAVRKLHSGAKGRLSIATISTWGDYLGECLKAFRQRYPDIVVDITVVSGGDALQDEGQDPYDFHFIFEDMLTYTEEFDCVSTHGESLCLIYPKGMDFSTERLDQLRYILITENESPILYMQMMEFFRYMRFSPNVVNQSDDVYTILLSVAAGLGVTILPESQAKMFLSDKLDYYPIGIEIRYAIAWKRSLLNPAANLFLQVLQDRLQH